jgi:acyl dehydratase
MNKVSLSYNKKPGVWIALLKALLLPRKGFDAGVGLPDIQARWQCARTDPGSLKSYCSTLDIKPTGHLPIAYPHVIAGPMHINMLSHQTFPIRLLGALHLKNRIVQYRPIGLDEIIDIDAKPVDFRLVDKGVEFDLVTRFSVDGKPVWKETSIYFVRGRFGGEVSPATDKSFELTSLPETDLLYSWHIPKNRGRQYARLSGDYNPIHVSALAARTFGFECDIAHGFGVLAQALEYSKRLGDAGVDGKAVQVDVAFKGPVFLGSDVSIRQNPDVSADRFDVYCDDNSKPSLCVAVYGIVV